MRRVVGAGLIAGLSLLGVTLAGIAVGPGLAPSCADLAQSEARYDVAIVLGGGLFADGRLRASSASRVRAGVALYKAGRVQGLHMTGGSDLPHLPTAAAMARDAGAAGVPALAISVEEASRSTLQNALFSKPLVAETARVVLVTEGYHLSRSWLSFVWAGLKPDALCYSDRVAAGQNTRPAYARLLTREVLASWANLVRASGYSLALRLGLPSDALMPYLR